MGTRITLLSGLLLIAVFAAVASSASPQTPPPREDYNSGAYLYRVFCASCHGDTGKGDGPVADLSVPRASDLTTIRQRSGGVFPRTRVMGVLDGTIRLQGHDAPAMPHWRNVLRRTERDDDRVIRQRLEALVSHVEELQK